LKQERLDEGGTEVTSLPTTTFQKMKKKKRKPHQEGVVVKKLAIMK